MSRRIVLSSTPSARRPRRGFALPLVILVVAVLTAALAAGFAAVTSEFGTTQAQRGQARAFTIAQTALDLYLNSRDSLCNARTTGETCVVDPSATVSSVTVKADSLRVRVAGGYADIVAHQLRYELNDTLPALFFARARGVDTTTRVSGRDTSYSQRAVGVMVTYNSTVMQVLGAWTSISGIQKNGTAGIVSGIDACGQKADVAGIVTPKGDFDKQGNWTAVGSPPADTFSTLSVLKSKMKIDWNAVVNQNAIGFDFEIPQQSFPSTSWFAADTTRWPVIRIHTNGYVLPNQGRGIIIADSNFTISGSNMWDGIVLVGGRLISDGNNTTSGATVSGLNMLLPGSVDPGNGYVYDDATLNGQKNYEYDSCKVAKAGSKLRKFTAIPNTWLDDVPTW